MFAVHCAACCSRAACTCQSEEDKKLKEALELAVVQAKDADVAVSTAALQLMAKEIREATSSMTSVPKPLKFLSPFYGELTAFYAVCVLTCGAHRGMGRA